MEALHRLLPKSFASLRRPRRRGSRKNALVLAAYYFAALSMPPGMAAGAISEGRLYKLTRADAGYKTNGESKGS